MKLHSKFSEISIFFLILVFFLVPPFFTLTLKENPAALNFNSFPFFNLIYFIFAVIFYNYYKEENEKPYKYYYLYKALFPFTLTLGALFFVSFTIKGISFFITETETSSIVTKNSFNYWLFAIISFFCSAFFEETLYRFYFPEILYVFLRKINNKKILFFICETSGILIFAFAHSYLGYLAIINSAFAQIILRFCFKKSDSIIPGFIAHFIYNVFSLILL